MIDVSKGLADAFNQQVVAVREEDINVACLNLRSTADAISKIVTDMNYRARRGSPILHVSASLGTSGFRLKYFPHDSEEWSLFYSINEPGTPPDQIAVQVWNYSGTARPRMAMVKNFALTTDAQTLFTDAMVFLKDGLRPHHADMFRTLVEETTGQKIERPKAPAAA
jgi:hypothetical protein